MNKNLNKIYLNILNKNTISEGKWKKINNEKISLQLTFDIDCNWAYDDLPYSEIQSDNLSLQEDSVEISSINSIEISTDYGEKIQLSEELKNALLKSNEFNILLYKKLAKIAKNTRDNLIK